MDHSMNEIHTNPAEILEELHLNLLIHSIIKITNI